MKSNKLKNIHRFLFAMVISSSIMLSIYPVMVHAEGASTNMYISVSSTTINLGKTFTVTLMVEGENIDIVGFDAQIRYDSSKVEIVKKEANILITKPAAVPSTFTINPNLVNNTLIISGEDPTLSSPIKARGATALVTFTFKTLETASVGTSASFEIINNSVTNIYNGIINSTLVTPGSSKNVTIGPKLDTNAYLSALNIETVTMSPAFSKTVTAYKANVSQNITSIVLNAQKEVQTSKITISGGSSLNYGDNTVTVTVTAQDPDAVKRYTITVNRAYPEDSSLDSSETSSVSEVSASSEDTSSETSGGDISAAESSSESSPGTDPAQAALQFWKLIAFLFIGLFAVSGGVMIWLLIDKLGRNGNQIQRIDRDIQSDMGAGSPESRGMNNARAGRVEKVKIKKVKIKRIK